MKRWLKRVTPARHQLDGHKHLSIFGRLLKDPNLWHLNRRSASGAFAVGLFVMYIPLPAQMVIAAAGAIATRVNLPISVALVWITNPLTAPPMYYLSYLVGTWVLGQEANGFDLDVWLDWHSWVDMIAPLFVGGFVCGAVCALIGYLSVQALWRWNLMRQIRQRRTRLRGIAPRKPAPPAQVG